MNLQPQPERLFHVAEIGACNTPVLRDNGLFERQVSRKSFQRLIRALLFHAGLQKERLCLDASRKKDPAEKNGAQNHPAPPVNLIKETVRPPSAKRTRSKNVAAIARPRPPVTSAP